MSGISRYGGRASFRPSLICSISRRKFSTSARRFSSCPLELEVETIPRILVLDCEIFCLFTMDDRFILEVTDSYMKGRGVDVSDGKFLRER